LQILEIVHHKSLNAAFEKELRIYLEIKAATEKEYEKLINDGLHVIANPVTQLITEED
jgi:phenylalanine-4-hydroxylase